MALQNLGLRKTERASLDARNPLNKLALQVRLELTTLWLTVKRAIIIDLQLHSKMLSKAFLVNIMRPYPAMLNFTHN
jgi:hypothetical protein